MSTCRLGSISLMSTCRLGRSKPAVTVEIYSCISSSREEVRWSEWTGQRVDLE